jgi:organic radical activating enzyme
MHQTKKLTTKMLPVMEHFYTLQGEGFHQGKAAYFIRLGGCDVGCVWCDVKVGSRKSEVGRRKDSGADSCYYWRRAFDV